MKTVLRFAALAAFLATGICFAQTPAPVDATLTKVKGSVLVNHGEMFVDAVTGTTLKANDRVMAMDGASAYIRFFEGCEQVVPAGTVVVVSDQLPCDCQNFKREKGTIARVDELNGNASLKVGESFSSIGLGGELVVGDVFRTGADSNAVIQFRDGCRTEIAASSEYTIPDNSPCSCAPIWLGGGTSPMTLGSWARIVIPAIIIVGISLDDNDGPISP